MQTMRLEIKKYWLLIGITLILALIWYANYSLHFNGFFWSDCHDYNQMARNIYEGKGFSTSVLRPIHFQSFLTLPHSEVTRPLGYPYMIAGSFLLFGPNDFAVVIINGFFYILLVISTFLLSIELLGNRLMALMVASCIAFSSFFLRMSIIGSSDIVYAALVVLFFYIYVKYPEKTFIHGLIVGGLYLTRSNTVFLIAALLVVDYNPFKQKGNLKRMAVFAGGAVLTALPLLVKNIISFAEMIPSVNTAALNTRSFPGFTYWVQLDKISTWNFINTYPGEFYEKLVVSFWGLLKDFRNTFEVISLGLMILGIFLPLKNEFHRRLRRIIVLTILIQTLVIISVVSSEARYYMFLIPFLISFVFIYLNSINRKNIKFSICAIILAMVIISSFQFWREPKQINYYKILGDSVRSMTKVDDTIASDMAWGISWYAERKAVWLPYDSNTLHKISKTIPIDYVFLSIDLSRPFALYKDNIWQHLFFRDGSFEVPGFELTNIFYFDKIPIGIMYKFQKNIIKQG